MEKLILFMQNNYVWVTPILVAFISGVVTIIVKLIRNSSNTANFKAENINNSTINQVNGSVKK